MAGDTVDVDTMDTGDPIRSTCYCVAEALKTCSLPLH